MKLLLVEDTIDIGESIQLYMEACGFEVVRVVTVGQAEKMLETTQFDCTIIDWMLPDRSGVELCQIIKNTHPALPVILETAKFQIDDKIDWFDAGADDYLVKPYDLKELEIRVRKLIETKEKIENSHVADMFTLGELVLNLDTMQINAGDKLIHCTANERVVLKMLCEQPGNVISRIELADYIRGDEGQWQSENKLDVLISGLRKKLGKDVIETVKWVGYRIGQK